VNAPGFTGTKNFGNRLAGAAIVDHVVGTATPATPARYSVNLIGEFNIAGELWQVLPLFDKLGIRVVCSLSGDARFHQVQMMHTADVSMMVCSRALLNVARRLKEKYDIPYFEGSFYGAGNTAESIMTIVGMIGDQALIRSAEKMLEEERKNSAPSLNHYREKLAGKKALLYTGGVKSWSLVSALQELGMTVVATGTKKSTEEDKQRIRSLMGDDATLIEEGAPKKLLALYHENNCDILLAGGRNQYTAIKARLPFVDVNQERETPFTGFAGHVNLARAIATAISSPAFALANAADPFAPGTVGDRKERSRT
jgi:nitrogenase molybdenum-cofactor synthesis protein NifE